MGETEKIREEARKYHEGINPCHDFTHTERVVKLALDLGKKENADLEVIELASILHDIGRKEQDESNGKICHAEKGAELSRNILKRYGYDKETIDKVAHCIESHRFRNDISPETKEAKILFDADKLDSIGAIGIGRAFSFAGHIGAKVHDSKISIEKTKEYTKEDSAYREFLVKLSKVKDKILTKTARKIAEERHNFMTNFFDRINKEVIGEL